MKSLTFKSLALAVSCLISTVAALHAEPASTIPTVHIVHADGRPATGARAIITTSEGKGIIGTAPKSGIVTFPEYPNARVIKVTVYIMKKPSGRSEMVVIEAVPAKTEALTFPLTVKLKE
jgi:hypothetical protein